MSSKGLTRTASKSPAHDDPHRALNYGRKKTRAAFSFGGFNPFATDVVCRNNRSITYKYVLCKADSATKSLTVTPQLWDVFILS